MQAIIRTYVLHERTFAVKARSIGADAGGHESQTQMNSVLNFARDYLVGTPAAYPLIGGLVAFDAVLPLIPSELVLISGALIALQGGLTLWLVFLAGVLGAILGDSLVYVLGSRIGQPAADRVLTDQRSRRRLRWARRKLCRHGEGLLVASRFLPAGRTAAVFAAGMLSFPWRRFLAADVVAASLSVGYLMTLGFLGGRAFAQSFWPSFAVSLGIAVTLVLAIELARHLRQRFRP